MLAVWLTTQQLQSSIAFLPVNPTLSPLRNQGRQKLATLNAQEFAQLVIDILLDTKRRQALSVNTGRSTVGVACVGSFFCALYTVTSYCVLLGEVSGKVVPMSSEDKSVLYDPHDYDEVPMDESRSPVPPTSPSVPPTSLPHDETSRPKAPLPFHDRPLPPVTPDTAPPPDLGTYAQVC